MGMLLSLLRWFSGNGKYMTLVHCMDHDRFWISLTVTLDLAVATGYVRIAHHWWVNQRALPDMPAKRALSTMRNIFALCGICGYIFIPIKMFWPAWRLYDMFLIVLVYNTWKYALSSGQLKVVYSELGRSTKLAADLADAQSESKQKTAFLNALSHDLRTPLNGMLLQAEVARLGLNSNDLDTIREGVEMMEMSARATADLLNSLLQCARLDWSSEPNILSNFNLHEVIARSVTAVAAQGAEKSLKVDFDCPLDLIVRTDRVKIERILSNLLVNAVKFTDAGTVRIQVACIGSDVEIQAIDTGIGLSAVQQEHLFDEFYQANNLERDGAKGFGLGLAISKRLVAHLGGEINVTSEPGLGSRFSVLLRGIVAGKAENGHPVPVSV